MSYFNGVWQPESVVHEYYFYEVVLTRDKATGKDMLNVLDRVCDPALFEMHVAKRGFYCIGWLRSEFIKDERNGCWTPQYTREDHAFNVPLLKLLKAEYDKANKQEGLSIVTPNIRSFDTILQGIRGHLTSPSVANLDNPFHLTRIELEQVFDSLELIEAVQQGLIPQLGPKSELPTPTPTIQSDPPPETTDRVALVEKRLDAVQSNIDKILQLLQGPPTYERHNGTRVHTESTNEA